MNHMSKTGSVSPHDTAIPSLPKTLRRLFLTLFLRGHSAQGIQNQARLSSVAYKLWTTLALYALIGIVAVGFTRLPVFALAIYLHGTTFAFLAMFLASTAGAVLFNSEEADILMHRPIEPQVLLWAKIYVLIEVSLWIAGAFNLAGFFVGFNLPDGGLLFVLAHALSVCMEAAFCAGCVVMVYQLCLRWCGRERLDGLITTAQVGLSLVAVLGSQILPQLVIRQNSMIEISKQSWWIVVFPPAWFAGLDDIISGQWEGISFLLALLAIATTIVVMWIAFDRLARDYGKGVQKLNESVSVNPKRQSRRKWIEIAIGLPPWRWWLRDPVVRASFMLTTAYLLRDRDVKLRVFPAMAPIMIMPIMMLFQEHGREHGMISGFGIAFAGSFLSVVSMMGLSLMQFSQQWKASDVFRASPLNGPALLCRGARMAILCWLALPAFTVFSCVIWGLQGDILMLPLLVPGIIALPVFALIPCIGGNGVPLSLPVEDAKGASRGLAMFGTMIASMLLALIASWCWSNGFFLWFLLAEAIVAAALYSAINLSIANATWRPLG